MESIFGTYTCFKYLIILCTVFLLRRVPQHKELTKIQSERGAVSYTNAREKRFQNAVSACILLKKNFSNSIPS
jgi:hypothetical protein